MRLLFCLHGACVMNDGEVRKTVFRSAYSGGRPVRLKEETRLFCEESLCGRYGDEAMKTPFVVLDGIGNFGELDPFGKYDAAIRMICETAPVRVTEHELVSGAATLGGAVYAQVPAQYKGQYVFPSINHLTVDFFTPVLKGVDSIEALVKEEMGGPDIGGRKLRFLESCLSSLESMRIYHKRYISELEKKRPDILPYAKNVPFRPASNFREAVQSLWFTFSFLRLTGNWPGIGRIDRILGKFLEDDLERGLITLGEARELLASFFIKGCEWVRGVEAERGSGDAQHYQNIVLGGTDSEGNDITNDVTYLILDIVEELPIGDFPITVRFNAKSPEKLYRRVAEVIRHGGGTVAMYNEKTILEAMTRFGYAPEEAADFANDGCWEVQVPGCTRFSYWPFDSLQILLKDTLKLESEETPEFLSFEQLKEAYFGDLKKHVDAIANDILLGSIVNLSDDPSKEEFRQLFPTTVIDLFENDCVKNKKGYLEGGTRYSVIPPHIGGSADTANSLYAIKKLCFDDDIVPLNRLLGILKNNWEGEEYLRQYARNKYVYYGNDNPEVDSIMAEILDRFSGFCEAYGTKHAMWIPSGVSTFGRQLEWKDSRPASPFGSKRGEILAGNASPTPGTDLEGATAVIKSYCAADLTKQVTGAALDVKLFPHTVSGNDGIDSVSALIKGFLELGGYFMQLDVADVQTLLEARKDPAAYKSLSVRVSGWNARFVSLDDNWQRMIIEREAGGQVQC